ncbi:MAG: phosphoglycerate kinase [Gammaproteobacteria bacterium]|nr:phosphoglycerate kinase [Gammaproteobacteria bacterium]
MAKFLTLDDVDVAGRRVLVRSDLNVPISDGEVTDDFRIRASLPTIERLRDAGAVVVVCSHLGRPKHRDPGLTMDPVAERMSALGGFAIDKLDAVVGPVVEAAVARAGAGDVILLENTRFEPGETSNDPALADGLARLADLFVLDAFGSAHRAHASTVGVAERLRSVAGPLLVEEVEALTRLLEAPERPFTVVLGGAKVSDKLGVIRSLLPKVDMMLIGGGMCFTLLAAEGYEIGKSLFEEDRLEEVSEVLASPYGDRISLPQDLIVADRFAGDAQAKTVDRDEIPDDWMGLDIGPKTAERFTAVIHGSRSVFWNGPMGVFEWERFRAGTEQVARSLSDFEGFSVVGGGDSVAAMRLLGLADTVSHLSTGGGAGLEMLEGKTLPGVAVLERWADGS